MRVIRFDRGRRDPSLRSDEEIIAGTLKGDRVATLELARRLEPAVRARVLRATRGRDLAGYSVDDLVQEVWCRLLERDARRLRGYDPTRGKTFRGYVNLVAGQVLANVIETSGAQKRRPAGGWTNAEEAQEAPGPAPSPERVATDRQELDALWRHLEETLPPIGRLILQLLYVDRLSPAEAARCANVEPRAIHDWTYKIRRAAKEHGEARSAAAPR